MASPFSQIRPIRFGLIEAISLGLALAGLGLAPAHAAPSGAPGIPFKWPPALKQAIGSAYEKEGARSPVWFTVAENAVSEVFYPRADVAQSADLRFVVTDGRGYFSEQRRDTQSKVTFLNEGLTVGISGKDRGGRYEYNEEIVSDPYSPVLRIRITFRWLRPGLRVFALWRPALGNGASPILASATGEALIAATPSSARREAAVAAALVVASGRSTRFGATSTGYVGFSDPEQDLARNFLITEPFRDAGPGHVALGGEIPTAPGAAESTIELALGFGRTPAQAQAFAQTSIETPFARIRLAYEAGWNSYLKELQARSTSRFIDVSAFARRSAQLLKMLEDKGRRGAIVSSLSHPAIPGADRSIEVGRGGYHIVRPQDLVQAGTALLAVGDPGTANAALRYLVSTQRLSGPLTGTWANRLWIDGASEEASPALQLEATALPVLLADRIRAETGRALGQSESAMVRRAANAILANGPTTPRDRWGELGGYVPATLAAEIAALRAATRLLGDPGFTAVADLWQTKLESWVLVPSGSHGQNYYLRASPRGAPQTPEPLLLPHGAGPSLASEGIDPSFLALVRLGVREADDPRIVGTWAAIDSPSSGLTASDPGMPNAPSLRRYPRDAYGLNHKGGYWPLLAAELGLYQLAAGNPVAARNQLFTLERSAIQSGLLPEQLIAPPSPGRVTVGLGVASPLAWAHAEDIILHRSLEEGRVFDRPRPLAGIPQASP